MFGLDQKVPLFFGVFLSFTSAGSSCVIYSCQGPLGVKKNNQKHKTENNDHLRTVFIFFFFRIQNKSQNHKNNIYKTDYPTEATWKSMTATAILVGQLVWSLQVRQRAVSKSGWVSAFTQQFSPHVGLGLIAVC